LACYVYNCVHPYLCCRFLAGCEFIHNFLTGALCAAENFQWRINRAVKVPAPVSTRTV
jgi:hypothetical protein